MTHDEQLIKAALDMAAGIAVGHKLVPVEMGDGFGTSYICPQTGAGIALAIRAIDPADVLAKVPTNTDAVAGLAEAARALGAMPDGYCFCSANRIGDDSKIHEPECAGLRASLVAKENEQCQISIGPATGATTNGPRGSDAGVPAAVANSHTEAVTRLVEAARWVINQTCEGFCRDLPSAASYEKEMDLDCGGCRVRAALAAMEASHDH